MSLIKFMIKSDGCLRAKLLGALTGTLFTSVAWGCTTDCAITVNFTGVYNDETCNVIINNVSNNETVTLPKISTTALQGSGSEAGSVPFDITLKDCPASRTITAFFNSSANAADATTGNLINETGESYSNNVQIRLRKEDGSQVIIDDSTSGQNYVISSSAEQVTHGFSASYYATGNATVTAGLVMAIASIELVYK